MASPLRRVDATGGSAAEAGSARTDPSARGARDPESRPSGPDPDMHPCEAIVQGTDDFAMVLLDATGAIRLWNRGAERLNGYAADEVMGRHISLVGYPPNDVVDHRPEFALKVAAAEGRHEETGWRVRKDGTTYWANTVVTALRDPDDRLAGYALVSRDMTQKRHEEEALRQSEERYRLLVDSVRDYAIFLLDPDGRVASWNRGAQRIKGYAAGDIVGEHFSRFYLEEDRRRGHPDEELAAAQAQGRYEEEGWRVRKDGTTFWANVVITALFDLNGQLRGYAKVTRDLTERKRQEDAQRQHTAELAALAGELEAFNYAVAHDLRAPLAAIIDAARLLMADDPELPLEARGPLLEALHASATRMAEIVDDLLTLSSATKTDLHPTRVDVSALAEEVARMLLRQAKARPAVRVQPGLAAHADPRMLRIALENLLGNAIKFSARAAVPVIEVGQEETQQGPAFYVRDNGVGFDPTKAAGLFRPFHRLHPANEFEGTGIGLATVARIIRRHGGEVWAKGTPGQGATFYFTLDAATV